MPPTSRQPSAAPIGAPTVPFTAAAHEYQEPAFDVTITPGAASQQVSFDVPPYGYARHLLLDVEATGGTIGSGVLSADYPENLFESINVQDVNGANIFGPLDGYATLWSNIIGGYTGCPDPRSLPYRVATLNSVFTLRTPFEISHRTGLGALANQNSAATYKVFMTIRPSTVLYTTAPTAIPAFRIRGKLEAWTVPDERNLAGQPQADVPPMLGTTQFWSGTTYPLAVGENTIPIKRVGSMLRSLLFISRTSAGARSDAVWGEPTALVWDARTIRRDSQRDRIRDLTEKIVDLTARDTGVWAYLFNHIDHGMAGDDDPTLWLPTVESTRLELLASNVATAGNVQIIVNDIAPIETRPDERYELTGTGFHPELGIPSTNAL